MNTIPTNLGFELEQVYCFKDCKKDPWTFSYIPGAPTPEVNAIGQPTISLITSQKGSILQLQTQWHVESTILQRLKAEVAKRHSDLNSDLISVEIANIEDPQVTLSIANGQSKPKIIGHFKSSGFPPYSTLINIRLTKTDTVQVLSALEGLNNHLWVIYSSPLIISSSIQTRIEGDVSADIKALRKICSDSSVTLAHTQEQIEKAIQQTRLSIYQNEIGKVSNEVQEKSIASVKRQAAQFLFDQITPDDIYHVPEESTIKITDEQTVSSKYIVERQSDVSCWFSHGDGMQYLQVSPTPLDEPERTP